MHLGSKIGYHKGAFSSKGITSDKERRYNAEERRYIKEEKARKLALRQKVMLEEVIKKEPASYE